MRIIVLGSAGQLGQCLKKVFTEKGVSDVYYPDKQNANILDVDLMRRLFEMHRPSYVINCAAYTAVDKAEDETVACQELNVTGPLNIAVLCNEYKARLIHVSTDFVFEGNYPSLLKETDETLPINWYGITKLAGEKEIEKVLAEHYILRTSWLYSEFGNNFVKTMLRLGSERDELGIIVDQIGTPTYAIDLAEAIASIIESDSAEYGVYHYSNLGVASWYDFAMGVFELSNTTVKVNPITTDEFPTRARRPKFSVMDKSNIKSTFNIGIPYWRDSLAKCLIEIKK